MENINEKFEKYTKEKAEVDLSYVFEQYEKGVIDEESLIKSINPALTRAFSTMFNSPKLEKGVRHYMKIRRDFDSNHQALRVASSDTGLDYRALEKIITKMISKNLIPKEMSIKEEFDDLSDLINTMNNIVTDLEK